MNAIKFYEKGFTKCFLGCLLSKDSLKLCRGPNQTALTHTKQTAR